MNFQDSGCFTSSPPRKILQTALSLCVCAFFSIIVIAYATAFEMAEQILNKSPRANEVTKYMLNVAHNEDTEAMIEALGGGMISSTKDKAEGMAAFVEKRKPNFKDE